MFQRGSLHTKVHICPLLYKGVQEYIRNLNVLEKERILFQKGFYDEIVKRHRIYCNHIFHIFHLCIKLICVLINEELILFFLLMVILLEYNYSNKFSLRYWE